MVILFVFYLQMEDESLCTWNCVIFMNVILAFDSEVIVKMEKIIFCFKLLLFSCYFPSQTCYFTLPLIGTFLTNSG